MKAFEEFINKDVKIEVKTKDIPLFFTAHITNVTFSHIFFTDKFGDSFSFRLDTIVQINEIHKKEGDGNGK